MRIISGLYKGRRLAGSPDLSIRPTTDRTKEYIFNILQDFPLNSTVIDIFSGSGSLGLEALSRGAAEIRFVEKAATSIAVLKANLEHVKIPQAHYQIVHSDALEFCSRPQTPADLILVDPPYKYPPLQELLENLFRNRLLKDDGLLVLEHEVINPIQMESDMYEILRQKKISRSLISFIQYR